MGGYGDCTVLQLCCLVSLVLTQLCGYEGVRAYGVEAAWSFDLNTVRELTGQQYRCLCVHYLRDSSIAPY